jgi:hypothetical protein
MACHREDRNVPHPRRLLHSAAELESIHPGDREIRDDGVRRQLARFRERLVTVVSIHDPEPGTGEEITVHDARAQIVFDDEHEGRGFWVRPLGNHRIHRVSGQA